MIRKARIEELDRICDIYDTARVFMAENGNPDQWGKEKYPARELLEEDISKGQLYVFEDEDGIGGAFVYYTGTEEEYETCVINGAWKETDAPYGVLHRIAVAAGGKGIGSICMNWCYDQCHNMRGDTHVLNKPMQRLFQKNGFTRCTELQLSCGHRIGYEKGVEKRC